jgi:hypothetical protein
MSNLIELIPGWQAEAFWAALFLPSTAAPFFL